MTRVMTNMVPMDPDPFGEGRKRRLPIYAQERQAQMTNAATPGSTSSPSRAERVGRRAGRWAAQSRLRFAANVYVAMYDFTATLTRPARDFIAKLKRSKTAILIGSAIWLALWVWSIVYSIVTGEGSGPG